MKKRKENTKSEADYTNDNHKSFCKIMHSITHRYSKYQVFKDMLQMFICSHHPKTLLGQKDDTNEKLYLNTISTYDNATMKELSKLLSLVYRNVLDNPYEDLLGEYYQEFISNPDIGQFFTPQHICELMAMITINNNTTNQTIADNACGSGRMLLAGAKLAPNNYFYGADVDEVCSMMSAINFFMNGLSGEVVQMNSLSNTFYKGWHILPKGIFGIVPISEKEHSFVWRVGDNHRKDYEEKAKTNIPTFEEVKPKKVVIKPLSLF